MTRVRPRADLPVLGITHRSESAVDRSGWKNDAAHGLPGGDITPPLLGGREMSVAVVSLVPTTEGVRPPLRRSVTSSAGKEIIELVVPLLV